MPSRFGPLWMRNPLAPFSRSPEPVGEAEQIEEEADRYRNPMRDYLRNESYRVPESDNSPGFFSSALAAIGSTDTPDSRTGFARERPEGAEREDLASPMEFFRAVQSRANTPEEYQQESLAEMFGGEAAERVRGVGRGSAGTVGGGLAGADTMYRTAVMDRRNNLTDQALNLREFIERAESDSSILGGRSLDKMKRNLADIERQIDQIGDDFTRPGGLGRFGEAISRMGVDGILSPNERFESKWGDAVAMGIGSLGTFAATGGTAGVAARLLGAANTGQRIAQFGTAGAMAYPLGVEEAYQTAAQFAREHPELGITEEKLLDISRWGGPAGLIQIATLGPLFRRVLGKDLANGALEYGMRRMVEAAGTEFAVENAGGIYQNVLARTYNPDHALWEMVPERGAASGTGAAFLQAMMLPFLAKGARFARYQNYRTTQPGDDGGDGGAPGPDAWGDGPGGNSIEGTPWNDIMGVPANATTDQIEGAYRRARSLLHPDRIPEGPQRDQANAALARLNKAHDIGIRNAIDAESDVQERGMWEAVRDAKRAGVPDALIREIYYEYTGDQDAFIKVADALKEQIANRESPDTDIEQAVADVLENGIDPAVVLATLQNNQGNRDAAVLALRQLVQPAAGATAAAEEAAVDTTAPMTIPESVAGREIAILEAVRAGEQLTAADAQWAVQNRLAATSATGLRLLPRGRRMVSEAAQRAVEAAPATEAAPEATQQAQEQAPATRDREAVTNELLAAEETRASLIDQRMRMLEEGRPLGDLDQQLARAGQLVERLKREREGEPEPVFQDREMRPLEALVEEQATLTQEMVDKFKAGEDTTGIRARLGEIEAEVHALRTAEQDSVEATEGERVVDWGKVRSILEDTGGDLVEAARRLNTTPEWLQQNMERIGYLQEGLADAVGIDSDPRAMASRQEDAPIYFSQLARAVENLNLPKASGDQWIRTIRNQPGVKQEEIEWTGIEPFLAGRDNITKEEVTAFLEANGVQLQERLVGEASAQLEGLVNHSEALRNQLRVYHLNFEVSDAEVVGYRVLLSGSRKTGFEGDSVISRGDEGGDTLYRYIEALAVDDGKDLNDPHIVRDIFDDVMRIERLADDMESARRLIGQAEEARDYEEGDDGFGGQTDGGVYTRYMLGGGTNPRALVIKVPEGSLAGERDHTSHAFPDRNIIAWTRFNERADMAGRSMLFVEEIQSDLHQQGRESGYLQDIQNTFEIVEAEHPSEDGRMGFVVRNKETGDWGRHWHATREGAQDSLSDSRLLLPGAQSKAPDAPFKKTWHELALRRMLRYAIDNGFESIGWTTGQQQADRYDLSAQIEAIYYTKLSDDRIQLEVHTFDGRTLDMDGEEYSPEKLPSVVGKEIADRIIQSKKAEGVLREDGLTMGGEGMKAFYDRMLVNSANKMGKPYGVRVEKVEIDTGPVTLKNGADIYGVTELSEMIHEAAETAKARGNKDLADRLRHAENKAALGLAPRYAFGAITKEEVKEYLPELIESGGIQTVYSLAITPEMRAQAEAGEPIAMFARNENTKAKYEARIDELYEGSPVKYGAARVLDRSDVLDLLGHGDKPVYMLESAIKKGHELHQLTAEDWKKIPEWLDDPAAVFDSEQKDGRLVFFSPEPMSNGKYARMILVPQENVDGSAKGKLHLLINAFESVSENPMKRWADEGLLRYVDTRTAGNLNQSFLASSRGLLRGAPGRRTTVLSNRDLFNYRRKQDEPDVMRMVAGGAVSAMEMFDQEALKHYIPAQMFDRKKLVDMPIDDFLAMAKPLAKPQRETAEELLQRGDKYSDLPFLMFDNDGDIVRVVGHEGRHRALALKEAGYTHMPVVLWSREQGKGQSIRWSEQMDPESREYVAKWPSLMQSEKGETTIQFPVSREGAVTEYAPAGSPLQQTLKPSFKRWFKGSKVANEDGTPRIMFHATDNEFTVFRANPLLTDGGAHFGTVAQANRVAGYKGVGDRGAVVMPVYLRIKKPLRLKDVGLWRPQEVSAQLADLGLMSMERSDAIGAIDSMPFGEARTEAYREAALEVRHVMRQAGYDGIVYLNRRENTYDTEDDSINTDVFDSLDDEAFLDMYPSAEDSYIAFDSYQIKSAVGNDGRFDSTDPSILRRVSDDEYRSAVAQVSFEAMPSKKVDKLPGLHSAPMEIQQAYLDEMLKELTTPDGINIIAKRLQLDQLDRVTGVAAWGLEIGRGAQDSMAAMLVDNPDGTKSLPKELKDRLDAFASALGLALMQDAVIWHVPYEASTPEQANMVQVDLGSTLTDEETRILYAAMYEKAMALVDNHEAAIEFAPVLTRDGFRVFNRPKATGISNPQFHAIVDAAVDEVYNALEQTIAPIQMGADVGYNGNDWSVNNYGESYQRTISDTGGDQLLGWVRDVVFPRVARIDRAFSEKYGLGITTGRQYPGAQQRRTRGSLSPPQARSPALTNPRERLVPRARSLAQAYLKERGIPQTRAYDEYVEVDEARGAEIARAFEEMKDAPNDPTVRAAYEAMAQETKDQFLFLQSRGIKFEVWTQDGQPYADSAEMLADVRNNDHLWFFPTEAGFGVEGSEATEDHPLLQKSGVVLDGKELVFNDLFRAVHDYFGHALGGYEFGPRGEENAWRVHADMYSPEARGAVTSETRGQNSVVNFGPHGAANQANPADTVYADQKVGLLPEQFNKWATTETAKSPETYETNAGKGIGREAVISIAMQLQANLKANIPIFVVNSPENAPYFVYRKLKQERNGLSETTAAFVEDPNGSYILLFSNNIEKKPLVVRAVVHETVGHFGVRAVLDGEGSDSYNSFMDQVIKAFPAAVRRAAHRNGITTQRKTWDMLTPRERRWAAEEHVAYSSEELFDGQGNFTPDQKNLLQRIWEAITNWLNKHFGKKNEKIFGHDDIVEIIRRSKEYVRSGNYKVTENNGAVMRMVNNDVFYSQLVRVLDASLPDVGSIDQLIGQIKNMTGFKAEELKWSGLIGWLESIGEGKVISNVEQLLSAMGSSDPAAYLTDDQERLFISSRPTDVDRFFVSATIEKNALGAKRDHLGVYETRENAETMAEDFRSRGYENVEILHIAKDPEALAAFSQREAKALTKITKAGIMRFLDVNTMDVEIRDGAEARDDDDSDAAIETIENNMHDYDITADIERGEAEMVPADPDYISERAQELLDELDFPDVKEIDIQELQSLSWVLNESSVDHHAELFNEAIRAWDAAIEAEDSDAADEALAESAEHMESLLEDLKEQAEEYLGGEDTGDYRLNMRVRLDHDVARGDYFGVEVTFTDDGSYYVSPERGDAKDFDGRNARELAQDYIFDLAREYFIENHLSDIEAEARGGGYRYEGYSLRGADESNYVERVYALEGRISLPHAKTHHTGLEDNQIAHGRFSERYVGSSDSESTIRATVVEESQSDRYEDYRSDLKDFAETIVQEDGEERKTLEKAIATGDQAAVDAIVNAAVDIANKQVDEGVEREEIILNRFRELFLSNPKTQAILDAVIRESDEELYSNLDKYDRVLESLRFFAGQSIDNILGEDMKNLLEEYTANEMQGMYMARSFFNNMRESLRLSIARQEQEEMGLKEMMSQYIFSGSGHSMWQSLDATAMNGERIEFQLAFESNAEVAQEVATEMIYLDSTLAPAKKFKLYSASNSDRSYRLIKRLQQNPMMKTWPLLIIKDAMRMAAEAGNDFVVWADGSSHAQRWGQGSWVDGFSIGYRSLDGEHRFSIYADSQTVTKDGGIAAEDIWKYIGKDAAVAVLDDLKRNPLDESSSRSYVAHQILPYMRSGLAMPGLFSNPLTNAGALDARSSRGGINKIFVTWNETGLGLRAYYDEMHVRMVDKFIKPYGEKVTMVPINIDGTYVMLPGFKMTTEMKEQALDGMPMWSRKIDSGGEAEQFNRTEQEYFAPNIRAENPITTPAKGAKEQADINGKDGAKQTRNTIGREEGLARAVAWLNSNREAWKRRKEPGMKALFNPVSDLGFLQNAIEFPRNIAILYPQFAPVWRAGERRFELRDQIINELFQSYEPYHRMPIEKKLRVDLLLQVGRLEGRDFVEQIMDGRMKNADFKLKVKNSVDTVENRIGEKWEFGKFMEFDAAEQNAYVGLRNMFNRQLGMLRQQILTELGLGKPGDPWTSKELVQRHKNLVEEFEFNPLIADPAAIKALEVAIEKVQDMELAERSGYVPFSRFGNLAYTVIGPSGETAHNEWFDTDSNLGRSMGRLWNMGQVNDKIKALKEQFPTKEGYQHIGPYNVGKKIIKNKDISMADIDMLAQLGQLKEDDWQDVRTAFETGLKTMGWRSHLIGSSNVPGWSLDFERSMADSAIGFSNYLASRVTREEMDNAIHNIDDADQPVLKKYAIDWNQYISSPNEEFQRYRMLMYLLYIADNVSSWLVNSTQVPVVTFTHMSQFENPAIVGAYLGQAYKDYALMLGKLSDEILPAAIISKAPLDVRAELQDMHDRGMFVPRVALEQMGMATGRSPVNRTLDDKYMKIGNNIATMYSAVERMNRIVTAIAVIRLGKKRPQFLEQLAIVDAGNALVQQKLDADGKLTPTQAAELMIDDTHFRQGKLNRPRIVRGAGAAIFQFLNFMMNTILLMVRNFMKNSDGRMAVAMFAMMMITFSGLRGLPGVDTLRRLYEALSKKLKGYDVDVEAEFRTFATERGGDAGRFWADVLIRGPVSVSTGFDMSHRVGLGRISQIDAFTDNELYNLLGIPGDFFIGKSSRAIDFLKNRQYGMAATQYMTPGSRNLLQAYLWSEEGIKSRGRTLIPPDNLTSTDIASRAIGFQPTNVTRVREREWAAQRAAFASRELQARMYTLLADAVARDDKAREENIWAEIDAWNARQPEHLQINISFSHLNRVVNQQMEGYSNRARRPRKSAREEMDNIRHAWPPTTLEREAMENEPAPTQEGDEWTPPESDDWAPPVGMNRDQAEGLLRENGMVQTASLLSSMPVKLNERTMEALRNVLDMDRRV